MSQTICNRKLVVVASTCNHISLYPKSLLAVIRNARDSQQVERVRLLIKEKALAHHLVLAAALAAYGLVRLTEPF